MFIADSEKKKVKLDKKIIKILIKIFGKNHKILSTAKLLTVPSDHQNFFPIKSNTDRKLFSNF